MAEGRLCGYVLDIIFDENLKKIIGFKVADDESENLYFLNRRDIFSSGDDCVMIDSQAVLEYDFLEHKISPVATIMQAIVLKALLAETMVALKEKGHDPFTWTNSLQAGGIEANSDYMHKIWGQVKSM